MDSSMNYYELLGVLQNASEAEIKSAYKKQMKKWHPDINKSKDASSMSILLNEAKETLLDEDKRKKYDLQLKKDIQDNYNKYNFSHSKPKGGYSGVKSNEYAKVRKVSKWEYFKEYLKYAKEPWWRKCLGVIGVIFESLLCFVLKIILIGGAFLSNLGSYLILMTFTFMGPILGLLGILLIGSFLTDGFAIFKNNNLFSLIIVFGVLYVLMIILPIISRKILSPKVFDILYNKIDINLFKWCVGYKD